MSTISVQPSKDAAASVAYVLYGNDKQLRERLRSHGQTRAAALALSMQNGRTAARHRLSSSPVLSASRRPRAARTSFTVTSLLSIPMSST